MARPKAYVPAAINQTHCGVGRGTPKTGALTWDVANSQANGQVGAFYALRDRN